MVTCCTLWTLIREYTEMKNEKDLLHMVRCQKDVRYSDYHSEMKSSCRDVSSECLMKI